MQYTTNYQLKKPDNDEVFDQQDHANYNWALLDGKLKEVENKANNAPVNSVNDDAIGTRTPDQSQIPTSPGVGKLSQLLSWVANRIKAITGKTNWWDTPDITLSALKTHASRHQPGSVDPIPTAAPSGGLGTSNAGGTSTSLARADHIHLAFDSATPAEVGTAASAGTSSVAARKDHIHTLGASSATDTAIGNRTISDVLVPTGDSAALTTLLGWLANRIKSITGKINWWDTPTKNLEQINNDITAHLADNAAHSASQKVSKSGDIMTGNLAMSGISAIKFGDRFELKYNPATDSLDIEVI